MSKKKKSPAAGVGERPQLEARLKEIEERCAELESSLEASAEEARKQREACLRARADHDNLRKRSARELVESRARARGEALTPMLEILDDLDRALDEREGGSGALLQGVTLIRDNMKRFLRGMGVEPMTTKGARFDPNLHEAFGGIPTSESEPDTILQEVRSGYLMNGDVLRPARVIVAVAEQKEANAEGEE